MSTTALIFLTFLLFGCVAAIFVDPYYGVLLYVFEYFLNPINRWWWQEIPHLSYALIIGVVILLGYILRHEKYADIQVWRLSPTKWFILLIVVMLIILPYSIVPEKHQEYTILMIKYFILYYLIIKTINTPKKFEQLISVYLFGQFYFGWLAFNKGRSHSRLEGIGGPDSSAANMVAAVLVIAVPLLIHFLMYGKKWQKIASLFILAFVLNAIILINSRGAFLAFGISLLYFFIQYIFSKSELKIKKSWVVIILICSLGLFFYLTEDVFWQRMATLQDPSVEGSGYRMLIWEKAFDVVSDYPFGIGRRGFTELSPQYVSPELLSNNTGKRAVHNTYLQALTDLGYVGMIVFAGFLVSTMLFCRRMKKELVSRNILYDYSLLIALSAGFIAHLAAGMFINRLYSENLYWCIAFITAYGNILVNKYNLKL